jgi:predicted aspartyl protease
MRRPNTIRHAALFLLFLVLGWLRADPVPNGTDAGDALDRFMTRLGYVAVRMEIKDQSRFILRGRINGQKTTFLVDTGCSVTSLAKSRAKGLPRLEPGRLRVDDAIVNRFAISNLVLLENLELEAYKFFNQPAHVTDLAIQVGTDDSRSLAAHPSLGGGPRTLRQDAILGADFFRRHGAVLRTATKTLYLRDSPPAAQTLRVLSETLLKSGMAGAPLTNDGAVHLYAKAELDGQEANLFLDTGSLRTVVDAAFAAKARMTARETGSELRGVYGRKTEFGHWEVGRFNLGAWETKGYQVTVADLGTWGFGQTDAGIREDGVLGLELLARMGAIIDYGGPNLFVLSSGR